MASTRPSRGRIALAAVLALLSLNALAQVVLVALGRSDDPAPLVALQMLVGASGAAAAWGTWRSARWAAGAAMAFGLISAAMLASLGPLVDVPADARGGLYMGAVILLLFGAGAAWYLRRQGVRT